MSLYKYLYLAGLILTSNLLASSCSLRPHNDRPNSLELLRPNYAGGRLYICGYIYVVIYMWLYICGYICGVVCIYNYCHTVVTSLESSFRRSRDFFLSTLSTERCEVRCLLTSLALLVSSAVMLVCSIVEELAMMSAWIFRIG